MSSNGFLHLVCHKTKLCKYFARGRCTRQPCDFAHSIEELQPVPNLSRTKVCPTLLQSGHCDDSTCTFAHKRTELRRLPPRASERAQRGSDVDSADLGLSRQTTPGELPFLEGPPSRQTTGGLSRQTTPGGFAACGSPPGGAGGAGGAAGAAGAEPAPQAGGAGGRGRRRAAGAAEEEPEGLANRSSPKFHTTLLCTFYARGKCKRGFACHFAHGDGDLHTPPDLYRTKLCPRLLNSGYCSGDGCRYAHNKEELRKLPSWAVDHFNRSDEAAGHLPEAQLPDPDFSRGDVPEAIHQMPEQVASEIPAVTTHVEADSPTHAEVRVKNTFLTVDELPDISPQGVLRTQTMPDLWPPCCSDAASDEDETCSLPVEDEVQGGDDMESPESCYSEQLGSFNSQEVQGGAMPERQVSSCRSETSSSSCWKAWEPQGQASDLLVMQHEDGVRVHVKNTFLSVDEPREVQLPRYSRSQPNLLAVAGESSESLQGLAAEAAVRRASSEAP